MWSKDTRSWVICYTAQIINIQESAVWEELRNTVHLCWLGWEWRLGAEILERKLAGRHMCAPFMRRGLPFNMEASPRVGLEGGSGGSYVSFSNLASQDQYPHSITCGFCSLGEKSLMLSCTHGSEIKLPFAREYLRIWKIMYHQKYHYSYFQKMQPATLGESRLPALIRYHLFVII